ncbi:MAG: methionyl-tRNA formyltransferase [Nevskiales bacterium]
MKNGAPARIVFAGSPQFAVPALARLVDSRHRLVAVLTQPDRPAGRGRRLQASAVKEYALARGLEVLQPVSLRRDEDVIARLRACAADLMVVVAYGLILPRSVLEIPARGCINLHASLLPRWRGAAPIQAAVLAGDERTGVSLMRLDEGLDTGPVAASRTVVIGPAETAGELHDRLALLGADLLLDEIEGVLDGTAAFAPQGTQDVTYAGKLSKEEARLDWSEPALTLERRVRAYNPWPVAETRLDGLQLRCWMARALAGGASGQRPGTVVASGTEGVDVQTGNGLLRLTSLQLAGRQRLDAGVFANGYALAGKVLGP